MGEKSNFIWFANTNSMLRFFSDLLCHYKIWMSGASDYYWSCEPEIGRITVKHRLYKNAHSFNEKFSFSLGMSYEDSKMI